MHPIYLLFQATFITNQTIFAFLYFSVKISNVLFVCIQMFKKVIIIIMMIIISAVTFFPGNK